MTTLVERLLPCPFCGEKPIYEFDETYVAPYGHSFMCGGCAMTTGSYQSKDKAAEAWNTREESSATIERLTQEIEADNG